MLFLQRLICLAAPGHSGVAGKLKHVKPDPVHQHGHRAQNQVQGVAKGHDNYNGNSIAAMMAWRKFMSLAAWVETGNKKYAARLRTTRM